MYRINTVIYTNIATQNHLIKNLFIILCFLIGFYIYTEASGGFLGTTFTIESPYIVSYSSFCFTFWYNRYGATIGPLHVYDKSELLTTIQGNSSGDDWLQAEVTIDKGLHRVGDYKMIGK